MPNPLLIASGLVAGCFTLAVTVEPQLATHQALQRHERSPLEVIMGEGRRFFAGHFFVKADVYFHSGYYPGIFDGALQESHPAQGPASAGTAQKAPDFLGQPRDVIDRFSRSFFPSTHTHLGEEHQHHEGCDHSHDHDHESSSPNGEIREMLPWLKITAELDPNRVETYTVGAYWLRTRMGKADQAETFLRDGLQANPGNPAILFELGRIHFESHQDVGRARNIWEAALRRWETVEKTQSEPDSFLLLQISWHLATLEEKEGQIPKAIEYLKIAQSASPKPEAVESKIKELLKNNI